MNKYNNQIDTKVLELEGVIAERRAKAKDEEAKAHVASLTRQKKMLSIIKELLSFIPEDATLSKTTTDAMTSWTAPMGERPLVFQCKAGDTAAMLLEKYGLSFSGKKLLKYCEKNGLKYNRVTQTVEEA